MELIKKLFEQHCEKYNPNNDYKRIITFLKDKNKNKKPDSEIELANGKKVNFLKYMLHEQHNPLGSHGGNYIDLCNENKKKIIYTINGINSKGYKGGNDEIKGLGFKTTGDRALRVVYNRVFCAAFPDQYCTIPGVDQTKKLLKVLYEMKDELEDESQKLFSKEETDKNGGNWDELKKLNWAKQNNIIVKILDAELVAPKKLYDNDYIFKRNTFAWKLYMYFTTDFLTSNQIIKYGAPGTGKTYLAKEEAENFFDTWKSTTKSKGEFEFKNHFELVQFHPSFTYEDFMEGIRPAGIKNGQTKLKLKDGIFKAFCKKAAQWEIELYELGLTDKKYEEITVGDIPQSELKNNSILDNLIKNVKQEPQVLIKDLIPPCFFVIDEINRAELSRVFGELMYCLEYRGYEGKVKTQYAELQEEETIFFKDKDDNNDEKGNNYFFIPHNLFIIGTMNTIDRSVESFDFALRRRFTWQKVEPNYEVLEEYLKENSLNVDLANALKKLNEGITGNPLLGEDYQIGHAYLMKKDKYLHLTDNHYKNKIWEKHIAPILEEYFRGVDENESDIAKLKEAYAQKDKKDNKKNNEQKTN